jgi:hypothetical protein
MPSAVFEITRHSHKAFAKLRCGKCGHEEEVPRPAMRLGSTEKEGQIIKRAFERRKWVIGHRETHHRCPLCATTKDILASKFKVVSAKEKAEALFNVPVQTQTDSTPTPVAAVTAVTTPAKPSRKAILALVEAARARFDEGYARLDEIEALLAGEKP